MIQGQVHAGRACFILDEDQVERLLDQRHRGPKMDGRAWLLNLTRQFGEMRLSGATGWLPRQEFRANAATASTAAVRCGFGLDIWLYLPYRPINPVFSAALSQSGAFSLSSHIETIFAAFDTVTFWRGPKRPPVCRQPGREGASGFRGPQSTTAAGASRTGIIGTVEAPLRRCLELRQSARPRSGPRPERPSGERRRR